MKRLRHFCGKHPRISLVVVLLGALLFATTTAYLLIGWRLPGIVWLPDAVKYSTASDDSALSDLPVKAENVLTRYGRATRYTSAGGWQVAYALRPNILLEASNCPNVANTETVSPSACEKLGTFQGQSVYTIHRSLPSAESEYYVKLGSVFMYIMSDDYGVQSLDYINTFSGLPRDKVKPYLDANNKRTRKIQAKQQAEKKATDHNNSLAYTRLDFTPAIPTKLPSGWKLNKDNPIEIDGPDANHPTMVNMDYTNTSNRLFVSLHIGKLSDFRLGQQCGPSPGYSMEDLACRHKLLRSIRVL